MKEIQVFFGPSYRGTQYLYLQAAIKYLNDSKIVNRKVSDNEPYAPESVDILVELMSDETNVREGVKMTPKDFFSIEGLSFKTCVPHTRLSELVMLEYGFRLVLSHNPGSDLPEYISEKTVYELILNPEKYSP